MRASEPALSPQWASDNRRCNHCFIPSSPPGIASSGRRALRSRQSGGQSATAKWTRFSSVAEDSDELPPGASIRTCLPPLPWNGVYPSSLRLYRRASPSRPTLRGFHTGPHFPLPRPMYRHITEHGRNTQDVACRLTPNSENSHMSRLKRLYRVRREKQISSQTF